MIKYFILYKFIVNHGFLSKGFLLMYINFRYDARALLDFYREYKSVEKKDLNGDKEERKCQYERYRVLAFNKFK